MLQTKLIRSLMLALLSGLFFATSMVSIPVADRMANSYFSTAMQSATIAYATTRGLNAVVSVAKESRLELAPAGVGVSIAAGQLLDPIDDMTERLSSLLVAAIASLGIQKIGFAIASAIALKGIAAVLLIMIPLLWIKAPPSLMATAIKICLVLLLLRFMLPVTALISAAIYTGWLQPIMDDAVAKLGIVSASYHEISQLPPQQQQGFFSSMTSSAADSIDRIRQLFADLVAQAEGIITALLQLMTAWLAMFVIQVLLLPLAMLWLMAKVLNIAPRDILTANASANHRPAPLNP
ncbi:hypothetical protein FE236_04680 [Mariprofundus erugo]|uniref:hypothetical protein n=1 Tax=Mariprofundus erugo TaxID=2528639 RepID=UPI0010FEE81F|nr:hypothetical protein [Mariprofundus erugo]TLS77091.1 hypothetical protein FE236_04680 [Mariprofundus erugo]